MIPIKSFAGGLAHETVGVLTQGSSVVRWLAGERRNELRTRPVWSRLESFLGCVHEVGVDKCQAR